MIAVQRNSVPNFLLLAVILVPWTSYERLTNITGYNKPALPSY